MRITADWPHASRYPESGLSSLQRASKVDELFPDFLIVSPAKTGSTWLAANLRCHPGLFVPAIKEVKYFSSYCQWQDLDWYCQHFRDGLGRIKGEASPSYALLPRGVIRWIHALMPPLKIIYLMREPISRAWSHAKHTFCYREANFQSVSCDLDAVPDSLWQENLVHDWTLANGDYLGQLRRWLSVFPSQQLYVGFYESLAKDPLNLLASIFRFLGVEPEVDFLDFPVFQRINDGVAKAMPPCLGPFTYSLLHERTLRHVEFLGSRFGLRPPEEWRDTIETRALDRELEPLSSELSAKAFARDFDDKYIAHVLEADTAAIRKRMKGKETGTVTCAD